MKYIKNLLSISQVWGKSFLLNAEITGYYLISIGLFLGFILIIFDGFKTLLFAIYFPDFTKSAIQLLDKFLIALIFLEIFYTIKVALLEDSAIKCIEPFLLVGITALIRRLLILSFEVSHPKEIPVEKMKYFLIELLEIGILVILLIIGLYFLKKIKNT